MNADITFFLTLSVVFPFLIGLIRYKKISEKYRPFLIYIIISLITEITSYITIKLFKSNLVVLNIFSLAECVLLVMQFNKWGFISKYKNIYHFLLILLIIAWISENFLFSVIDKPNRIFLISYSFLLVLLSIREINQAMILSNETLHDNARVIICIGIMIFFTFTIIAQTFRLFGSGFSKEFMKNLYPIVTYTNAITNIIYAFGVYYIPGKTTTGILFKDEVDIMNFKKK